MKLFKVLVNFTSQEFSGTQYLAGHIYKIRQEGEHKLKALNKKTLTQMSDLWAKAQRFKVVKEFEFFGVIYKKDQESYFLEDSFGELMIVKEKSGDVAFIPGSLITFDDIKDENSLEAL